MSISSNLLNATLRDNIQELCEHFFPNGKVKGDDWAIDNIAGEKGESLRISLTQGGIWHDFATDEKGTFAQLIQTSCGVDFPQAATLIGNAIGVDLEERVAATGTYGTARLGHNGTGMPQLVPKPVPFDWSGPSFADLNDGQKEILSQWRGYTPEFVDYLSENHLIKVWSGDNSHPGNHWSFPIAMMDGLIRGHHSCPMSSGVDVKWTMSTGVQPFVIGDIETAHQIHIFESQWDMFAVCDKLAIHETDGVAAFCTRGAGNRKLAANLPKEPKLYAWVQNDELKNGKRAGEEWFNGTIEAVKRPIARVALPEGYKDPNEWVRDGYATGQELGNAVLTARFVEYQKSADPPLSRKLNEEQRQAGQPLNSKQNKKGEPRQLIGGNILQYARAPINKEATLLGNRYLCRDGGMFIVAPSGQGKSSLSIQLACEWALGSDPLDIQAAAPSRVLIIQGEDDDGDITEMSQWILNAGFSEDKLKQIEESTHIEPVNDVVGRNFIGALGEICDLWTPDILFINPYTSYLGGDPKDDKLANEFLREGLSPLLKRFHCGCIIMHHTPKTQYNPSVDFTSTDFMYRGAGCATMTNWSRSYMVFEPVNDDGLFRFVAAKRGKRIGWGSLYRFFRHSKQPGVIKWESASPDEIDAVINSKAKSSNKGPYIDTDTVWNKMEPLRPYTRQEFREWVKKTFNLGEKRADGFLREIIDKGLAQEIKTPRANTNPLTTYHKGPKPNVDKALQQKP
jgi:hypothetical protein